MLSQILSQYMIPDLIPIITAYVSTIGQCTDKFDPGVGCVTHLVTLSNGSVAIGGSNGLVFHNTETQTIDRLTASPTHGLLGCDNTLASTHDRLVRIWGVRQQTLQFPIELFTLYKGEPTIGSGNALHQLNINTGQWTSSRCNDFAKNVFIFDDGCITKDQLSSFRPRLWPIERQVEPTCVIKKNKNIIVVGYADGMVLAMGLPSRYVLWQGHHSQRVNILAGWTGRFRIG